MVRGRLLKHWRAPWPWTRSPVDAWAADRRERSQARASPTEQVRGLGGFVRSSWDEVNRDHRRGQRLHHQEARGPDRMIGFSPIPAMSMVSYAAGSRYLSLLGGVCMSFYDWYCDLPPASAPDLGRADRRPESADWYNSSYIIAVGLERAPDAHARRPLLHRGPLQGRQVRRHARLLRSRQARRPVAAPQAGHRRRLAMAFGHVILKEFHVDKRGRRTSTTMLRRYTDLPMLVRLVAQDGRRTVCPTACAGQRLRRRPRPGQQPRLEDRGLRRATASVVPNGSIGFRWGEDGRCRRGPAGTSKPRGAPRPTV